MLLDIIRPLAKLISQMHAPFSRKKITSKDYLAIRENMEAGDILLTKTYGELGNLFIRGQWKHVGIVGFEGLIIEATTLGVKASHLFDFLRTKDEVRMVRPQTSPEIRMTAASEASKLLGLEYDFDFQSDDEEYYCSELVCTSYKRAGREIIKDYQRILPSELDSHPAIYDSREV